MVIYGFYIRSQKSILLTPFSKITSYDLNIKYEKKIYITAFATDSHRVDGGMR